MYHSSEALPADDAPVIRVSGHRRENAYLLNESGVAALPQPPLLRDLLDVGSSRTAI